MYRKDNSLWVSMTKVMRVIRKNNKTKQPTIPLMIVGCFGVIVFNGFVVNAGEVINYF